MMKITKDTKNTITSITGWFVMAIGIYMIYDNQPIERSLVMFGLGIGLFASYSGLAKMFKK